MRATSSRFSVVGDLRKFAGDGPAIDVGTGPGVVDFGQNPAPPVGLNRLSLLEISVETESDVGGAEDSSSLQHQGVCQWVAHAVSLPAAAVARASDL